MQDSLLHCVIPTKGCVPPKSHGRCPGRASVGDATGCRGFPDWRLCFGVIVLVFCLTASASFASPPRFRYMGSSNIGMPTGGVRSGTEYIFDDSQELIMYSQKMPGDFLEGSLLRYMNGAFKDKTIFNMKLNLLTEDRIIPTVSWGVSDLQETLGSKIFYVAGSKSFETFGIYLHVGAYKDPVTTRKNVFYGVEKTIMSLVSLIGERVENDNIFGMKLRPYPGLDILFSQTGLGKKEPKNIIKLQYLIPF